MHLWLLCPLCNFAHLSPTLLLATSGEHLNDHFGHFSHFCAYLQNPDVVLVHYLNVPYPDDNKMLVTNSVALWGEKKEWTKEELTSQLKPMCKCWNFNHSPSSLSNFASCA